MTIYEFVKNIDPSIQLALSENYCADVDEKIVFIGTEDNFEAEELMQNFIKDEFGIEMDSELLAILHEIGHIMTVNDEQLHERAILDVVLHLNWVDSTNDIDEDFVKYNNLYFRLPSEYEATEWAVNYYKNHKDICDRFVEDN